MEVATKIFLATILLLTLHRLYILLFASRKYWASRGIPTVPGALPLIGNTLTVLRQQENLPSLYQKIYLSFPGKSMVGCYRINRPALVLRDPELIKTVLQTRFNNFSHNDGQLDKNIDPLFGRDPLFTKGQDWKDARVNFRSSLAINKIKILSVAIANVCERMDKYLADKTSNENYFELEGKLFFSRYSAEAAAACVFGINGNSFNDDYRGTLLEGMRTVMDPTNGKALGHLMAFYFPTLNKLFKNTFIPKKLDTYFRGVFAELEEVRRKNEIPRDDVLQWMLDGKKTGKVSDIEAIAHAFSFFYESFETGSLTLGSVCYYLAKDEKVQDRMREEISTVLKKHGGKLGYESINEMIYVEQVMLEAMRLVPPTGAFAKACTEAYRLEGSDGLAVNVRPGDTIIIPVLGLHTDPEIWKDPEEFNPDRFDKDYVEARHKFVYLPFSGGPKACPGQRLGTIQAKAAMATILKNYRIETSPKMQEPLRMDPRIFVSIPVGGYWCRFRPLRDN